MGKRRNKKIDSFKATNRLTKLSILSSCTDKSSLLYKKKFQRTFLFHEKTNGTTLKLPRLKFLKTRAFKKSKYCQTSPINLVQCAARRM